MFELTTGELLGDPVGVDWLGLFVGFFEGEFV